MLRSFSERVWIHRLRLCAGPVLFYGAITQRMVALTIDDGPHHATTDALLDVLRAYHVSATFFVISDYIPGNERLLERMVAEGHEVGNHLTKDFPSILLSTAAFADALQQADRALRAFTTPRWVRPASGWYRRGLLHVIHAAGYACVLGDILPIDVWSTSVVAVTRYIVTHTHPGSIITLHDQPRRGRQTVETLAALIPALHAHGYTIGTVSSMRDHQP